MYELTLLLHQVSRLGDEVREKENTILRHRLGPDWTPDIDQNIKVSVVYTWYITVEISTLCVPLVCWLRAVC